jgi:hypothetical protein
MACCREKSFSRSTEEGRSGVMLFELEAMIVSALVIFVWVGSENGLSVLCWDTSSSSIFGEQWRETVPCRGSAAIGRIGKDNFQVGGSSCSPPYSYSVRYTLHR